MSVLDLPSRKVFVCHLQSCSQVGNAARSTIKVSAWELMLFKNKINISSVWIQGIVVENSANSDEIFVDDGTGVAKIIGCGKIPPSCPRVKKGQYVMVIGVMASSGINPTVRAIKIQDLSTSVIVETFWILEVIDQALL